MSTKHAEMGKGRPAEEDTKTARLSEWDVADVVKMGETHI